MCFDKNKDKTQLLFPKISQISSLYMRLSRGCFKDFETYKIVRKGVDTTHLKRF